MKKILVTGQSSRFVKFLKKELHAFEVFYPERKKFNLLNSRQINSYIKKKKITHLIHIAGLSRPMDIHEKNISKSIDLNIIGTANIVKCCENNKIKLIYFSTNYVYPGTKGNYKETDSLKPINNYAWSKLGGECAVQMYNNSLIVRLCMTEKPFIHKRAYANVRSNFIYQEEAAKLILKILNKKGIINVGGPSQSIYNFAKKKNSKVKKIYSKGEFPKRTDMSLKKLKNLIKL